MNESLFRCKTVAHVAICIFLGAFGPIPLCSSQQSETTEESSPAERPIHRKTTAAAWDSLRKQIVTASDAQIECIDPQSLKTVRRISVDLNKIYQLAFSEDGTYLLVAGGSPSENGCVELYDWPNSRLVARHTSTSRKGGNGETSTASKTSFQDVVTSVCWLPDQSGWLEASWQGIGIVRLLDGTVQTTFDGHSGPLLAVTCLDDQHVVSAGIDQTIRIWNRHDGTEVRSLDNHTGSVRWLQRKQNPRDNTAPRLVSASADSTVRLWEPGIGRLVKFSRLGSPPLVVCSSPVHSRILLGLEDDSVVALDMQSLETKVLVESPTRDPSQTSAGGDRIEAMLVIPAAAQPSREEVIVWRQSGLLRLQH